MVKRVMVTRISAGTALLSLLLFAAGCTPGRPRGNDEVPPELTFDNVSFRLYRGPALTAQGTAVRAAFRRDTSGFSASTVALDFPASPGRPASRVNAARLTGNLNAREYLATGGVRAEQSGEVLRTERARYAGADGLVRGDARVEVAGRGFVASGAAFVLDPRAEVFRLEGGTRVVATGAVR